MRSTHTITRNVTLILDTLVRLSQVSEGYEVRSEEVGTALFDDSAHESVMRQPKQRILVVSSRVS